MALSIGKTGPTGVRLVRRPKADVDLNTEACKYVWSKVLSEDQIKELFGVDDRIMSILRYKRGLPFVTLYRGIRYYLLESFLQWMMDNEVTCGVDQEMYEQ